MNHIICGHYNANYGCGKCLKVFTTGQLLKNDMKVCKGVPKEAANEATTGNADCTHAMPEKKCTSKDPLPNSQWPPPQSSQMSLCRSQCAKKKPALTPKKSDFSHREEECSSYYKHRSRDKSSKKSSVDKHSPKKFHKKSSKKSSKEKRHEEKPGKEKWHDHNKTGKNKSSKK